LDVYAQCEVDPSSEEYPDSLKRSLKDGKVQMLVRLFTWVGTTREEKIVTVYQLDAEFDPFKVSASIRLASVDILELMKKYEGNEEFNLFIDVEMRPKRCLPT